MVIPMPVSLLRFKATEVARVVSLPGLKTLGFPLTEFSDEYDPEVGEER